MLVEEFLEASAARLPDKVAVVAGERRITYRELDERANALAHSLVQAGIQRGERVVICLANSIEVVLSIFGVLKAGGVFAVLSPSAKAEKIGYVLTQSRASGLIMAGKRLSELLPLTDQLNGLQVIVGTGAVTKEQWEGTPKVVSFAQCIENEGRRNAPPKRNIDVDLAALIYTSSSTGESKGVMLTHLNIRSAAASILAYLEYGQDDVILNVLPLSFDYGLYQVLMGVKVGARIVLEPSFAYPHAVFQRIEQERVTVLPLVPTLIAALLETKPDRYDLTSVRCITTTGAALPTDHIGRLRERLPKAKLFSMYGLTECKRVSYLPPEELDRRPMSVGKGMPNQELYLVDVDGNRLGPGSMGELVVRGSHVMKGYWNMPEETARVLKPGPWGDERVLFTGDWFRMDEEGYLYFIGRKDDMIKTGGKKVSPREVENVLHGITEIAEAAVIGVPDPRLGHVVKAFVRLRESADLTEADVIRHCRSSLEDYMVPKVVAFIEAFPRTDSGKVDKRALEQMSTSSQSGGHWTSPVKAESDDPRTAAEESRIERIINSVMEAHGQRTAVVYKNERYTYGDLRTLVNVQKSKLADAGLTRQDRAIIWMENSPEYVVTYLAVLELEAIVVALHPQTTTEEVVRIIRHVGAAGVIISPTVKHWTMGDFESAGIRFVLAGDGLHRLRAFDQGQAVPDGIAQIIYTSGSTGRPKGVVLTHRNLIANTRSILDYLQLTREDSVMAVLPFVYAYGNSVMLTHLFAGGALAIENNMLYPQTVVDAMIKNNVTGLSGVSTTYALLLNNSNFKSSTFPALRYLTHAGGPMPSELLGRIRTAFPDRQIYLMYGQTEASARLTYLPPELLDVKKGSAGRAIPGVRLKIVKDGGETARPGEAGEIWAFGDNIMQGYWQDPELTAEVLQGGWLRTGDVGWLDEEGFVTIVGRNNEMIKSGAYRISPTEIEEVLLQHPQILETGVVGIEDPILGQKICAVVVLKEEGFLTQRDLMGYCAQRLVPYKRPKVIAIVSALPKSPSGKILRHRLREIGVAAAGAAVPASS
ncbi:class I adenylate-forming enzyme family protein [Candidatus Nitrospira inopinata]|jgi:amino acid adenylation domain-containing protein|uniref:AMP-dependent synthetase and ligase (Modular protein) n=1 Tax=Candidatus Nitrospira inopinata TaxID=1715989 RepID=A0A0S4KVV5_9BACT|nr:AMP-binding protein [Candidatus Nitrospira inopinata]CUQ67368.1 AMP-dependent synthetase and ligase (modular protein) [Candidatus Nitrospira inopinata]